MRKSVSTSFGAALVVFGLTGPLDRALAQRAHSEVSLSAASSKQGSRQTRPSGQIACTVAGCQPIPPNCHPETGYNWDGVPTGFDIVVCRPPRGRRG